jgi:FixJ family two-component response regulator
MDMTKTIHLVDDDDAVRESLRMLLEVHGLNVRAFPSANALLEDPQGENADCFLLDLHMPGLSGLELLELLRKRGNFTPAILLTGCYDPLLSARLSKANIFVVLQKPPGTSTLLAAIKSAAAANVRQ